jgi:hypothetical protein
MNHSFLSALILLISATPAVAGTWVTYQEGTGSDSIHRTYQVDVQSIASHKGWIHSNTRICHDYGRDCKDPIYTASAHCKDKKLREVNTVTHTLRNNTEWWTSWQISDGTRYKFVKPGYLEKSMAVTKRLDNGKTLLFNFLCK